MMYTKSCPHCKHPIASGHGKAMKSLESPLKTCRYCGRGYIDADAIEWYATSTFGKLSFYYGNNRWIACWLAFVAVIIMLVKSNANGIFAIIAPVLAFIFTFAICILLTYNNNEDSFKESSNRMDNCEYVEILISCGYTTREIVESNLKRKNQSKRVIF